MENLTIRQATENDYELVYEIKKRALGKYVDQTWGWDEEEQREYHKNDFNASEVEILQYAQEDMGVLVVTRTLELIEINEIYIDPKFQNKGIGTSIMSDILKEAENAKIPVKLQFLKVNPVRALYEKLGFVITGENEHHFLMEKSV